MAEGIPVRLSVVILARNEERNLSRCLSSVRWADEVVVVDDFSTDGTVEIAHQFGARVVQRRLDRYDAQRNFGTEQSRGEWVLHLDADEEVSPELAQEIRTLLASDPPCDLYAIPFRDRIFGRWVRYGGWSCPNPRLHRRTLRWEGEVHERVSHEGPVGQLRSPILHHSHETLFEFVEKMNRYTEMEARQRLKEGKGFSLLRLILSPLRDFGRRYLVEQGFRDGIVGLLLAVLMAFTIFLTRAKVWELSRHEAEDIAFEGRQP